MVVFHWKECRMFAKQEKKQVQGRGHSLRAITDFHGNLEFVLSHFDDNDTGTSDGLHAKIANSPNNIANRLDNNISRL